MTRVKLNDGAQHGLFGARVEQKAGSWRYGALPLRGQLAHRPAENACASVMATGSPVHQ
jgi:hypothetical protein